MNTYLFQILDDISKNGVFHLTEKNTIVEYKEITVTIKNLRDKVMSFKNKRYSEYNTFMLGFYRNDSSACSVCSIYSIAETDNYGVRLSIDKLEKCATYADTCEVVKNSMAIKGLYCTRKECCTELLKTLGLNANDLISMLS